MVYIPYAPWCWHIYLHLPQTLPSFVGKYTSTMEHMGIDSRHENRKKAHVWYMFDTYVYIYIYINIIFTTTHSSHTLEMSKMIFLCSKCMLFVCSKGTSKCIPERLFSSPCSVCMSLRYRKTSIFPERDIPSVFFKTWNSSSDSNLYSNCIPRPSRPPEPQIQKKTGMSREKCVPSVFRVYSKCIPSVFQMCSKCIPNVFQVYSQMCSKCIPQVQVCSNCIPQTHSNVFPLG